jgi:subtilase family serine protease
MKNLDFSRSALGLCVAALAFVGCGGSQPPVGASGAMPQWQAKGLARAACPQIVGKPTCLALISNKVSPACAGASCGWAPKDFQTRYNLPITKGSGQVVAIVDAGDNPNAAADIAQYRSTFGLGTASFYKYNQEGQQSNYPSYTGWSVEIDLDIEMVSAACPLCTIYLVEANSSDGSDLEAAEVEAVTLGAHIVNNSWICYGSINCVAKSDFDTKGVVYVAAAGDNGYDEGAPMSFGSVVAVGGTQLTKSGSTYSETALEDGGGGCATDVPKPPWQHDPDCKWRTNNDTSAEAGCAPPVAEYDSYDGGWFGVCGSSVSSPLIGGVYGLAGNAQKQHGGKKLWSLSKKLHAEYLHAITTGGRDTCETYLCLCGTDTYGQYCSIAGWGTPNGLGAF